MKARESGMPDETMWAQFFDVEMIFNELEVQDTTGSLVELGFGYGTFTIPAAKKVTGQLFAYDIEDVLLQELTVKLKAAGIGNVVLYKKDFISDGSGLEDESVDYVMLFNILHAEKTTDILRETYRILKPGGNVGVIHWNYDASTPRGPSMAIRPQPEELLKMLTKVGFSIRKSIIDLPPYHYGILAQK
jgi:ubiquinone/menaquinone biosynthesis C-methylase UbiE